MIEPFALERYFARYEFTATQLLSASDCEALSMADLLKLADRGSRALWNDLTLGYTESSGHPLLRQAIAEIYPGLDAENVAVAAPEEGIFLGMHALLKPGDHVVCTFPAYQSLYEVARSKGADVSLWRPEEEDGWRFDIDRLAKLMRSDTKLVIVNFPHNPTGALLTRSEQAGVVELVKTAGAHLFSDEMYRFLEDAPDATLPAACELYDGAISLSGLSKSFGLPGLRVGWLATRDQALLSRVAQLRDYTTICNSAPSEILALIALRARSEIIATHRQRLLRNRTLIDQFFAQRAAKFRWTRPQAGTIGLARLLPWDSATAFCQTLLDDTGIMLVPSTLFDFDDHHVRIGFGREDLPAVLERLAGYLDETS